MNPSDITAALDAANIRHTPEAIAMLAECNAEPDWEQYREVLSEVYGVKAELVAMDNHDKSNIRQYIELYPHMPETKAMQAQIAELEAEAAKLDEQVETPEIRVYNCFTDSGTVNGWIDWHSGECPVGNEVEVEMKFRNGRGCTTRYAKHWRWSHAGEIDDILAYRVLP